jgi:flavodoxin
MKTMKWMVALVAAALMLASCGTKKQSPKVLVLYYSQTSHTATVAQEIQKALGADMEEIIPVVPYDGTYQETIARAGMEREKGILPAIQPIQADLSQYDLIFLGYPVWYGTYAVPMSTVLNEVDFSGKKIVPFCTFGSGGLFSSSADLAAKLPDATILPGYGIRAARIDAAALEVDYFLKSHGYMEGEFAQLEEFPASHPVSEEEAAIFDAAVGDYPMIQATATEVACRNVPEGVEYLFMAQNKPREGMPAFGPMEMKVYVLVAEGQPPVFTQVVR